MKERAMKAAEKLLEIHKGHIVSKKGKDKDIHMAYYQGLRDMFDAIMNQEEASKRVSSNISTNSKGIIDIKNKEA